MMEDRALILGGGSARGISQVGTLMAHLGREPEYDPRFIGGNSVGALNGAFLGQFGAGEFGLGIDKLQEFWFGIKGNRDIWRGGLIALLRPLWDNGFADPRPLQRLIRDSFDPDKAKRSGRQVRVSTVDLLSGEYMEFGEDTISWEHVYGSAAMPYAFPAIQSPEGHYLTDGGVLKVAPIKTAIKLGYKKLDIILNSPIDKTKRIHPKQVNQVKRMDRYGIRILDLILDQQFVQDMKLCLAYNKLSRAGVTDHAELDVRIFAPSDTISDTLILVDFSPDTLKRWYNDSLSVEPIGLEEFLVRVG